MEMNEKLFKMDIDVKKNMTLPIEQEVCGLRCRYKKGFVFLLYVLFYFYVLNLTLFILKFSSTHNDLLRKIINNASYSCPFNAPKNNSSFYACSTTKTKPYRDLSFISSQI